MMKISVSLPNVGYLANLTPKQAGPLLRYLKGQGFRMVPDASIVTYQTVKPKCAPPFGFRYVYRFYKNNDTGDTFGVFLETADYED